MAFRFRSLFKYAADVWCRHNTQVFGFHLQIMIRSVQAMILASIRIRIRIIIGTLLNVPYVKGPCYLFFVPNHNVGKYILQTCCFIGKHGFFTLCPIFIFFVIRYFFPSHSKNRIAQSTSQFCHSISTPFLPQHYNILFIIASLIFISH